MEFMAPAGSVTLPNRARNKSPGTSGSRRSDDFTPRLQSRCPEGSVRCCRGEMTLDVECVVGYCTERNLCADPTLLNPCILRSLRRVG
jgi:hypothetical protein